MRKIQFLLSLCLAMAVATAETSLAWADATDANLDDLIAALQNATDHAQVQAADALGKFGGDATKAIPSLLKTLNSPNPDARAAAAIALGEIGKPGQAVCGEFGIRGWHQGPPCSLLMPTTM